MHFITSQTDRLKAINPKHEPIPGPVEGLRVQQESVEVCHYERNGGSWSRVVWLLFRSCLRIVSFGFCLTSKVVVWRKEHMLPTKTVVFVGAELLFKPKLPSQPFVVPQPRDFEPWEKQRIQRLIKA